MPVNAVNTDHSVTTDVSATRAPKRSAINPAGV
jgi:hypothetical protein